METGRIDPQVLSGRGAGFNPNVNGLRGLCVAMVFVFHVASSGLPPLASAASTWQLATAYLVGSLAHGVEVFFMISGYVIVLSLRRHASLRGFLADRCLRIFPAWLGVLLAIVALVPWLGWQGLQPFDPLSRLGIVLANALLLPPLLPLPMLHPASWSLSYEWLFYLAAAAIAALSRDARVPRALWMPASALLTGLAVWRFPVAVCFLVGVSVALNRPLPPAARRWPLSASVALWLFLLLWRSVDAAGLASGGTLAALLAQGQGAALLGSCLAGAWFFGAVAAPGSPAMPLLRMRLLQRLGTISYSFYLCHLLVMFAVKRAVLRLWPDAAGSWSATLAFALLSGLLSWTLAWWCWRWLEQDGGHWLRQRLGVIRHRRAGLAS